MIDWHLNATITTDKAINCAQHVLIVSDVDHLQIGVFAALIAQKLSRMQRTWLDLEQKAITLETQAGQLVSVVCVSTQRSPFDVQTQLRKAMTPLLAEYPSHVAVCLQCDDASKDRLLAYIAWVLAINAHVLTPLKKSQPTPALTQVTVLGHDRLPDTGWIEAMVSGNTLCRNLTLTPPNQLTPALYMSQLHALAATHDWTLQVWDFDTLKQMGAGAFVAVAQGSTDKDAAIVKLSYRHPQADKTLGLVGKGICFDTGGHNLKASKYMLGMHQDMNGGAVALGVLQAITLSNQVVNVDCWLAIAQNHIGPNAYKQNDVVTALNGLRIEVIHTDAEGRMVLADTLTLAARQQPDVLIDYATLTGSMQTALGTRMSGVIANRPAFAQQWIAAGEVSGERVVEFPYAEDYDEALESEVADMKECTLDAEADHLLAARFLGKFVDDAIPWCHIDLSAYANKNGLGAVASEVNGFGVSLTMHWLAHFLIKAH